MAIKAGISFDEGEIYPPARPFVVEYSEYKTSDFSRAD